MIELHYWDENASEASRIVNGIAESFVNHMNANTHVANPPASPDNNHQIESQEALVEAARLHMVQLAESYREADTSEENVDRITIEQLRLSEYSEASKAFELQKHRLANMKAELIAQTPEDAVWESVQLSDYSVEEATLPLDVQTTTTLVGTVGPEPKQLLAGMTVIGVLVGLLLLPFVANRRA